MNAGSTSTTTSHQTPVGGTTSQSVDDSDFFASILANLIPSTYPVVNTTTTAAPPSKKVSNALKSLQSSFNFGIPAMSQDSVVSSGGDVGVPQSQPDQVSFAIEDEIDEMFYEESLQTRVGKEAREAFRENSKDRPSGFATATVPGGDRDKDRVVTVSARRARRAWRA